MASVLKSSSHQKVDFDVKRIDFDEWFVYQYIEILQM